jgi:hypothetical protein
MLMSRLLKYTGYVYRMCLSSGTIHPNWQAAAAEPRTSGTEEAGVLDDDVLDAVAGEAGEDFVAELVKLESEFESDSFEMVAAKQADVGDDEDDSHASHHSEEPEQGEEASADGSEDDGSNVDEEDEDEGECNDEDEDEEESE